MKLTVLVGIVCAAALSGGASQPRVTPDEAKALAMAALTPAQRQLPQLEAELDQHGSSRFIFVTVTWAGPPEGSVVVANFEVDAYTADVFSAVVCHEYRNRTLEALQAKVRARLELSRSAYHKLKTKGSLCEDAR